MRNLPVIGGLESYVLIALSLVACSSTGGARPDAISPDTAGDAARATEPGRDAAVVGADTASLVDAVIYAPNSRKCLLIFDDGSDCQCLDGTPGASDPSQCSTASVVTSQLQQGVCCKDAFGCECAGYACSSNSSTCVCSNIDDMRLPADGTPVRECPTPTAGQKCCLQPHTHDCICSSSQCLETGAVEASSCRLADIATCASDATSLANCR